MNELFNQFDSFANHTPWFLGNWHNGDLGHLIKKALLKRSQWVMISRISEASCAAKSLCSENSNGYSLSRTRERIDNCRPRWTHIGSAPCCKLLVIEMSKTGRWWEPAALRMAAPTGWCNHLR